MVGRSGGKPATRKVWRAAGISSVAAVLASYGASPAHAASLAASSSASSYANAIADFGAVWSRRFLKPSRYSDGTFHVLYSAPRQKVAQIESAHWTIESIFKTGIASAVHNRFCYEMEVQGRARDVSKNWRKNKILVHPNDYSICQRIGKLAHSRGYDYLLVPSARCLGGRCTPILQRAAAAVVRELRPYEIHWDSSSGLAFIMQDGVSSEIEIDNVFAII